MLRPLYQEKILPNVAYIGGPGELAYWLELKSLFDHYEIAFPVLMPRNSFLVIESSVARKMSRAGISPGDVFIDRERLLASRLKGSKEIHDAITDAATHMEATYAALKLPVASIDPTLTGSLEAEKQRALKGLSSMEEKIIRAVKKKEDTVVAQIDWVLHRLFPEGQLQERHQNILALARDISFVDEIVAASDPFSCMFDVLISEEPNPS